MGNRGYFVTGIGTDVGKTVVAMLLAEYLRLPYWKPIQTGDIIDTDAIMRYKPHVEIIPTTYALELPAAPLFADYGNIISFQELDSKKPKEPVIIEGAGGILVPITQELMIFHLLETWKLPVVLVARNYLGYINHTLLSIHYLKSKHIPIAAIIINDAKDDDTEAYIQQQNAGIQFFKIPFIEDLSSYSYKFQGL